MADIVNMYFEYYYYLDIIDNGLYNCYDLNYMERAQADADKIHAELDFVPGSNILLEKLNGKNHEKQWDSVWSNLVLFRESDCPSGFLCRFNCFSQSSFT